MSAKPMTQLCDGKGTTFFLFLQISAQKNRHSCPKTQTAGTFIKTKITQILSRIYYNRACERDLK